MATLKQHNFYFLFAGLLFLLLVTPLLKDLTGNSFYHVSEFTFSIFLLIGVWSLYKEPRMFLLGAALAVFGIAGSFLAISTGDILFVYVSLTSYIIFLLLSITLATEQVIHSRKIDFNNIIGAACIYLLLGVMWALLYITINILIPDSFSITSDNSVFEKLQDFIHFSFVTLTTLGYGDIVPLGATARALSTIEAVFGQFYIAILVAGLVAAYITQKSSPQNCSS